MCRYWTDVTGEKSATKLRHGRKVTGSSLHNGCLKYAYIKVAYVYIWSSICMNTCSYKILHLPICISLYLLLSSLFFHTYTISHLASLTPHILLQYHSSFIWPNRESYKSILSICPLSSPAHDNILTCLSLLQSTWQHTNFCRIRFFLL